MKKAFHVDNGLERRHSSSGSDSDLESEFESCVTKKNLPNSYLNSTKKSPKAKKSPKWQNFAQ